MLLTTVPRPVTPAVFLVELHKYSSDVPFFGKVIEAMKMCFQYPEIYKYELTIQAVDVVAREHPLDLIMYTLMEMITVFKESHRYIVKNVVPTLLSREIFKQAGPWKLMKELLWQTKPLSIKTAAHHLGTEQMLDYVKTFPEMKSLMFNYAKANRVQALVQLLSGEPEQGEDGQDAQS
jgi:hypothetical protein